MGYNLQSVSLPSIGGVMQRNIAVDDKCTRVLSTDLFT